ncbi:Dynamin-like protein [Oopsacas minuta]|uniref:Dynamin-like protein n=1 Tax=Oopsacas minuta TaxID=111878 RepID=A0AAV7JQP8_9METZ|nr:Dynamin-like protein [Oopsacas minuta]
MQVNQNLSQTSQTRLFKPLQDELLSRLNTHYEWKPASRERIKSCLQSVMRDRDIRSEREWQQGLDYMKKSVKERLQIERLNVLNVIGTRSWTSWHRLTPKQQINTAVLDEIKKIVQSRGGDHLAINLKRDDLDNIKKNLSYRKLLVNDAQIRYVWETVLRMKQLEWTESKGVRCMRTYHRQLTDPSVAVECHEVTLFHSVQQILNIVSREARIQMQGESQELELRVRAILQALSSPEEKKRFLRGDLVDLSDRIQRVREIIDRLDYFSIRLSEEQEVVN